MSPLSRLHSFLVNLTTAGIYGLLCFGAWSALNSYRYRLMSLSLSELLRHGMATVIKSSIKTLHKMLISVVFEVSCLCFSVPHCATAFFLSVASVLSICFHMACIYNFFANKHKLLSSLNDAIGLGLIFHKIVWCSSYFINYWH